MIWVLLGIVCFSTESHPDVQCYENVLEEYTSRKDCMAHVMLDGTIGKPTGFRCEMRKKKDTGGVRDE